MNWFDLFTAVVAGTFVATLIASGINFGLGKFYAKQDAKKREELIKTIQDRFYEEHPAQSNIVEAEASGETTKNVTPIRKTASPKRTTK